MNPTKAEMVEQFPTTSGAVSDFPPSISRDDPDKLAPEARAHTFFVRTRRPGLLANIGVMELLGECPRAADGEGVIIHKDVLFSLAYDLLDRVHELTEARKVPAAGTAAYDPRVAELCDKLGLRDAEIKELRAALGEAAIKIRRHEQKLFK